MKLFFEEEILTERQKMQCAYQQLGRDSPELCDGQKAIPAGHC